MASELMPCPVCQGKANILHDDYGYSVSEYTVYCKQCNHKGYTFFNKESAIKTWNIQHNLIYQEGK